MRSQRIELHESGVVFMQSRETQVTMVKWTNAGGQTKRANERSFALFTVDQHGGDDVTWKPPIEDL